MSEPKSILMFDRSPGSYFVATVFLVGITLASLGGAILFVPLDHPDRWYLAPMWAWAVGMATMMSFYKTRILVQ